MRGSYHIETSTSICRAERKILSKVLATEAYLDDLLSKSIDWFLHEGNTGI